MQVPAGAFLSAISETPITRNTSTKEAGSADHFLLYFLLFLFLTLDTSSLFGQTEGKVVDGLSGEPIPGCHIVLEKGGTGTTIAISNRKGNFFIDGEYSNDTLFIDHLSYYRKMIPFENRRAERFRIHLFPRPVSLSGVQIKGNLEEGTLLEHTGPISRTYPATIGAESAEGIVNPLGVTPGVTSFTGTPTTNRVTIRGIGSRSPYSTTRVKGYFGDIPITTSEGITTFETLPRSLISDLEVIPGPSSGIYGAGMGGVVRASPFEPTREGIHANVALEGSSYRTGAAEGRISFRKGGSFMTVGGSYQQSEGFRENSSLDRKRLFIHSAIRTDNDELTLTAFHSDLKAHIPSSLDHNTYRNDPTSAAESWRKAKGYEAPVMSVAGLQHTHWYGDHWRTRTTLFGKRSRNYEPRPFNILEERTDAFGIRSTTKYADSLGNMFTTWSLGFEGMTEVHNWMTWANDDRKKGEKLAESEQDRKYGDMFLKGTLEPTSKLKLSAHVNGNRTHYDLNSPDPDHPTPEGSYTYPLEWNPGFGASYRIMEHSALYLSGGKGFSPPSTDEIISRSGTINQDIRPEKGFSLDLGARGEPGKNKGLFFDLGLYYMSITNKLVAKRTGPDSYIGVNAGKASHRGAELTLKHRTDLSSFQLISEVQGAYQHVVFKEFTDRGTDHSSNLVPGIPEYDGVFKIKFVHDRGAYIEVQDEFRGSQYLDDENSGRTNAYNILHAHLGFPLDLRVGSKIWITAFVENILDKRYASMVVVNAQGYGGEPRWYYPGRPRWYGARVNLNF